MADVFAAGEQFVINNRAALQAELETNSAKGNKAFTVTLLTAFEPDYLRLAGNHMKTYFSGIRSGLLGEEIYEQEVIIKLNISDQIDTKVDLTFSF